MTFATLTHYVQNNLATDAAAYLDAKSGNFPGYFCEANYFNEDTIKAVLARLLSNWVAAQDANETAMVLTEINYPGFANRCDVAVVYKTDNGVPLANDSRLFIELKSDFDAESVNEDINLLDLIAGVWGSPITVGYAMFTVRTNDQGWTHHIDAPTQARIGMIPIVVNP